MDRLIQLIKLWAENKEDIWYAIHDQLIELGYNTVAGNHKICGKMYPKNGASCSLYYELVPLWNKGKYEAVEKLLMLWEGDQQWY